MVIHLQGLGDIVQRQPVLNQPGRVDDHLILLATPAPCVDLCNTGHLPQLGLDHPFVERRQLGQAGRIFPLAGDDVVEHLSQARRDRPHLRATDARGEFRGVQSFAHDLACKVDVRPILECDGQLRQPEPGDRTDIDQPGKA